ncbi:hypothetical protein [Mycobacteroides abscessus]|uniref:hypothetical protein n=1 Tax=Mycobacteroides abscessus TaxID=36809 RepID=UPI00092B3418|nr:hypothetical protein [Mycobacteroides abscessus]MDB2196293.1 hypothetical protein [Mycobacteroides abscessus subsp. abscessus]MDB2199887.1 hypothetical protein [Mycobacteroides abscessus subsp. abscessus]SIL07754.1 Uncharacterised protein [Mycobacteroides abscessus subsp. abscessus]SKR79929.1 Uncharacterised protein [Mycobacteroides abscessus subsp. abscessus]SKR84535.1 Uncharacterised protein [Mycobacteroides abscessus subsp. abscessus]
MGGTTRFRRKAQGSSQAERLADYTLSRGYEPLHPLVGPTTALRTAEQLVAEHGTVAFRSIAGDLAAAVPLSPAGLAAVEANQRRERQEIVDLYVCKARELRQEISRTDWAAMAATELRSIEAAEASGNRYAPICFHTADGEEESIGAAEVRALCKAYGRITCRGDIDAQFFGRNADAVLAHGVYITRCDTPEQAIGTKSWKQYLRRSKGDEQAARLSVASDIELVFVRESAVMFTTRAADPGEGTFGAGKISDDAQCVVDRWCEDTDDAWDRLPDNDGGHLRVILDRLLRPRSAIATEPFEYSDWDSSRSTSGGIYGPEASAVERLVEMLGTVDRSVERMPLVINEIIAQARAVRTLPRSTLVEYVERQWRLTELADLAEELTMNPQRIDEAVVLPVDHPDQLQLFAVDAAA